MYRITHWHEAEPLRVAVSRKALSLPRNHQLSTAFTYSWWLMNASLLHARMLTGLVFRRSWVGSHSFWEFMDELGVILHA